MMKSDLKKLRNILKEKKQNVDPEPSPYAFLDKS